MAARRKITAMEKELSKLVKTEQKLLAKRSKKEPSALNRLLEDKVPNKLQGTLDAAFAKAFQLIFKKGVGVIEKTYNKEKLQADHEVDRFAAALKNDRKSLRQISKKASRSGNKNLLVSGTAGIGLGLLGVGIPDIALFTGMMLKSIYEIALRYGYDYKTDEERQFILLVIQGSVAYGDELLDINEELEEYINLGYFTTPKNTEALIKETASYLSKELLYMKFLQGIPIVGAVGGAYDAVYIRRVVQFAELKYRSRFLNRHYDEFHL